MENKERDIFEQAMGVLYNWKLKKHGLNGYFHAVAVRGELDGASKNAKEEKVSA